MELATMIVCAYIFTFCSFIFQESPEEGRVGGGLLQGQGHWVQWCRQGTFRRRSPASSLPPPSSGLRPNNREGTQPHPSTENWIQDLLSMASPIRTRPSFPLSQSLPSGSFHERLILLNQRADNENHNHRKRTNQITWTTAFPSVQSLSSVWLFVTTWTAARQASLSITNSWSLPKLMSFESVMPPANSSSVIPFSSCPQSFPASGSFKLISTSHQVAKVLEFQLQHQTFQWAPRTDRLYDGLDGLPCSPRDSEESSPTSQWKSINSSVLSFLYGPTLKSIHDYWKTIALTRQTDIGKIMSLLFNMLSRWVITFLPWSKHF